MKTTLRFLVSAAGLSVGFVSAARADASLPSTTPLAVSFQKSQIASQSTRLDNDQSSKPAETTAPPAIEQSTRATPLSERNQVDESSGSGAAQAVNLPKVTIFAEKDTNLGQTEMLTAKGLAEMARNLHPEMTFKGQAGSVSLALYKVREDERLAQMGHYTQMIAAAAQENPQDKGEKKKMQDEMNQTYLRQRDSTTEFLYQFYEHR